MEDTIKQFILLPSHIKAAVSSPRAMEQLEAIEDRYQVKLADIVMRVACKTVPVSGIEHTLVSTLKIDEERAKEIGSDLRNTVLAQIANYLGFLPSAAGQKAASAAYDASLHVDPRDPEITQHASKLKFEPKQEGFDAQAFAKKLVSDNHLSFDPVLAKRFEKIVEARLVDVRDKDQTKDLLMRNEKVGGMEISGPMAEQIMTVIEREHDRIHALHLKVKTVSDVTPAKSSLEVKPSPELLKHPMMSHPVFKPRPVQPVIPKKEALQPIRPPVKSMPPVQPQATQAAMPPVAPIKPAVSALGASRVPSPQPRPRPDMQVPTKAPQPQGLPRVELRERPQADVPHFMPRMFRDTDKAKMTMSDIVPPAKLVGPVDELGMMTIKDFRMLGQSTSESASRIKEKIRMLERESYQKRYEGIKAWRNSPLMNMYLSIGRDSMEQNKNIDRIIADRQREEKETLTADEFEIIANLNSHLRF